MTITPSKLALAVGVAALAGGMSLTLANDKDDHRDGERRFDARLSGDNEVPPISTEGAARLRVTLNKDETELSFELTFQNLSANPAAAHIHFGPRSVNGGVMVFFCGGGSQPACPAATSGSVTGTITAANVVGPAAQGIEAGNLAKVVQALRDDLAYANIHTANFPAGEIRGQVN
jgi:CHRD domain-containing protein